jgi:phosphonate metabolism-associated iron-containing alcohol dehydrogenase
MKNIKNSFTYHMPTKIVYGRGSLENINDYIIDKNILIITSNRLVENKTIDKLKLENNVVSVITDVKSHPEFKDLEIIYDKIYKVDFDMIVAIGGGSIIDAAKLFSIYNDKKEYSFIEDIIKGKIEKRDYSSIPIIALPTTAGTSSEITPWATIWDMEEKKKYSLHLPELFPKIAIYDPTLTLSVPKEITIQTGLDMLSHALESIWNKNANPITISYAIKSAKLTMEFLPKVVNDLQNIEDRDKLLQACMYAGLAFSNTQTAIAHGMSYYITAHKGISHGIACSFTLPLLIDNIIGKYDFIDDALKDIFGELSSQKLRNLLSELNISTQFEDYGMKDTELNELKVSLQDNQRAGNSLVQI